jgi:HEAT repeat protein
VPMTESGAASSVPSFWQLQRSTQCPRTRDEVLIPYTATLDELKAQAQSAGSGRWAAFVALGHSPDASAIWPLILSTFATDWRVRRAACEALALHARRKPVIERISELLDDPVPSVVRMACSALGALKAREHRGRVLALLFDPDEATRHVAVAAVDRLWESSDSPLLLQLVRTDRSRDVSTAAAAVLMRRVGVSTWKALFDAWIGHPYARYRIDACGLSEKFGDSSLMPRLSALRLDPDSGVRSAAQHALDGVLRGPLGIRTRARSAVGVARRTVGHDRRTFGVASRTRAE